MSRINVSTIPRCILILCAVLASWIGAPVHTEAQSATPKEPIDLSDGMEPKETPKPSTRPARPRKDIPTIAKAANGAIVSIVMSDKNGHAIAKGTGFLVSKDGHIVTNYHVIAEGSSAVVKLPDGAFFVVDGVLAFDKIRDVALIKAHGENFRTLTLGNSDRLQVGEDVVAIGNPLSLESTVSNGIVSGIRTDEERGGKFLQVTTPISPGSSGGPLFNMMGEVVGITTMYLEGGENLNFAIPINDAKRLLLAKSSTIRRCPTNLSRSRRKGMTEMHVPMTAIITNCFTMPAVSVRKQSAPPRTALRQHMGACRLKTMPASAITHIQAPFSLSRRTPTMRITAKPGKFWRRRPVPMRCRDSSVFNRRYSKRHRTFILCSGFFSEAHSQDFREFYRRGGTGFGKSRL